MAKRFVQMTEPPYDLIEVTDDYQPVPMAVHNALAGDRHYDGLRATDGTPIDSRTKHREFMRRNGLATADDYRQTWADAEKRRTAYRTEGRGAAVTRDDIGRAIHKLGG